MRQPYGGGDRLIEDAQFVVLLKRGLDAAQHGACDFFGRFIHLDDLEPASQRGIFLKILLVLRPGGGGDGAEFATGQGRLQEVGSIVLASSPACADHGVRFINEENDFFSGGLDLVDEALEAVFELAFDASACLQQGEIEAVNVDALQGRRDISADNAVGEAFNDGGLAHAGFAGEDGVVLAAAHEDVDHLANFYIATEDGVDFTGLGVGGEVHGVLIEVRSFATGG